MEQFEDYLDISSDDYENFKPVAEFHDYYEEFPTVYGDEEVRKPEEEEKKERKDSYVTLLFLAKCEEVDYYPAKRALNREIYRMAAEMNIPIPYPQIVLNQPMPEGSFAESTTTPKQKKEATAFVYNQAYDSEGMEAENSN